MRFVYIILILIMVSGCQAIPVYTVYADGESYIDNHAVHNYPAEALYYVGNYTPFPRTKIEDIHVTVYRGSVLLYDIYIKCGDILQFDTGIISIARE